MVQETTTDSYDSPWKEGLERYFPDFMAFFFPEAHAVIDWDRGHENLAEELRKVVRDAEVSERRADMLTRVWRSDGQEQYILVHVEVLADKDTDFPERMFVYNYRTYDRYRKPVVSLAVLGDESKSWRPEQYGWDLCGCRMNLRFPMVKLVDYKWPDLEASANPFAIVVMAHLKTKETHGDPASRLRWKTTLVRDLYQRGFERQDVLELFRLLDWMLVLPDAEESRFQEDLRRFESEVGMQYVTSIERSGIQKGIEQGIEQGIKLGEAALLESQLTERFGQLPDWAGERLQEASREDLERWGKRVLSAKDIEDVFTSK